MSIAAAPRGAPRIHDLPTSERPRERLLAFGPRALSTAELVAVVLRSGAPGSSALVLASRLVARFGLAEMSRATLEELAVEPGCGPAAVAALRAALELGRRAAAEEEPPRPRVCTPADVALLLAPEMAALEQEHLRVVLLSTRHDVLGVHEVYKGSVSASLVRVAEVFREPVRRNCPAIVVAHNHPSGDPSPSPEDIRVTRQLVDGGRLLDIDVLDHIIIGRARWVSLRERGLGFEARAPPAARTRPPARRGTALYYPPHQRRSDP